MHWFRHNHSFMKDARGARIVLYHGVCLRQHTRFNSLFLTLRTFEEQLRFYRDHFNLLTLEEYYEGRFRSDQFNICLTFDDGFANNYTHVLPLLEKYEVPAVFFITGIRRAGYDILWNDLLALFQKYGPRVWSFRHQWYRKGAGRRYLSISGGESLRDLLQAGDFSLKAEFIQAISQHRPRLERLSGQDYWLQMSEDQIRSLSQSRYARIGCHGFYHNDLSRLTGSQVEGELSQNRSWLEGLCGYPVNSLSFPYGNYNEETLACSAAGGFDRLLAVDFRQPGDRSNPLLRERMTVNPYISVERQMKAIIHGQY